jgi:hypothetical protein
MHVLVGILGGLLVCAMLVEVFLAFLVPRRVKRDPRFVRLVSRFGWTPWVRLARRLPPQARDTMLGLYGPLSLIINLLLWVALIIFGYACLQWAGGSNVARAPVDFGHDLYFSAATMFASAPSGLGAQDAFARAVQVLNAATGLAVLAIVIGYLPSLYQALSRRETTVSQLDARAGSPPSAGRLILRSAQHGSWEGLAEYLNGWETWAAELMETHLAYPTLAYFRSQHVNQSWPAAMCTILDTCVVTIACAPRGSVDAARFTYAIARHAVVDLSYTFRVTPEEPPVDRLPPAGVAELLRQLGSAGIEADATPEQITERLARVRPHYEPYIYAIAKLLELSLPPILAPEAPTDNWRTTEWH